MDNYEKRELISIVVPVYRIRDYLAGCIDSVLAQTYPYWELILVDDGSDDGSERICDDYAKRDPRITVIHQSNQGVSAARNQGVARAKGEYLAFLDADDRIEPQYLDVLYKDMAVQGADLVCCNAWEESQGVRVDYRCVSENRKIEDRESLYLDALIRKEQYGYTVWGKLFRTELVKQVEFSALRFGEDTYFMFRIFNKAPVVYLDSYTGYVYVRHEGGVMLKSGVRNISRRMDQLVSTRFCFMEARAMSEKVLDLAVQTHAANIHAAAAATVLGGRECCRGNREKILEYVQEVKAYQNRLSASVRVKLFLYEYIPIAYCASIRLLQVMGRAK